MRPRRLPDHGYEEIAQVARARESLPTNKELAQKWHVSVTWVKCLMKKAVSGSSGHFPEKSLADENVK